MSKISFIRINTTVAYDNISSSKAAIKRTTTEKKEYISYTEHESGLIHSLANPTEKNIERNTFINSIPAISQSYLWNNSSSIEFQEAWSQVTSSDWFSSNVTSDGYYVTGSTPNWNSGLDFPLLVSGSFTHDEIATGQYSLYLSSNSESLYYVSSSQAYNTMMDYTSSLFYEYQLRKM